MYVASPCPVEQGAGLSDSSILPFEGFVLNMAALSLPSRTDVPFLCAGAQMREKQYENRKALGECGGDEGRAAMLLEKMGTEDGQASGGV